MTKRSSFKYDSDKQALELEIYLWISPQIKHRLAKILELHYRLSKPFVVKTATKTSIWHRHDDGTLSEKIVSRQNPDEIVGSPEWLRKHKIIK